MSSRYKHTGGGFINSAINNLPFEAHIPGYQFCGPGTKLQKRLQNKDEGINALDVACKTHDIAYSVNQSLKDRHLADHTLEKAAWRRVKSKDAKLGEKAAALLVTAGMKIKRKLGMGMKKQKNKRKTNKQKKKSISLKAGVLKKVKQRMQELKKLNQLPKEIVNGSSIALSTAKAAIKKIKKNTSLKTPRVIPVPKQGGILPLIPIFAGLSALGALAGGAAGIAKAVGDANNARKNLAEATRHNKTMEGIAIGKTGSGLYLKPYRKGYGLYLRSDQKNF